MKIIEYPKRKDWPEILARPSLDTRFLERTVANILQDIRRHGDEAVRHCSRQFDGVELEDMAVTAEEMADARQNVSEELKEAIGVALDNIEKFHAAQRGSFERVETTDGVFCWRKSVPIERVGLYAPGGTAPLFSSVLMLGVPARLAGCREVVLCSPPDSDGRINDVILYTAELCGITRVFKIGGAQAVGAIGFGTETVPRVDKIFGPGNQFVTEAKQQITRFGVQIDMPAGPSEVAVWADGASVPAFVAADLLSQAEHGPDSQVLLVSTDRAVIEASVRELEEQLEVLPRREIAARSIENSRAILVEDEETALDLLNEYAAEHLILALENADEMADRIINAGSVFIGNYSCEAAGDYASGTNHTLPTGGYARSCGGVSLDSFVKKITFQKLTAKGIENLGPTIERMAEAERLEAHRTAVSIRLKALATEEGTENTEKIF
ncbi:MAG: histidinol dehydrogenase [Pyrinomonadaceae bacterium]